MLKLQEGSYTVIASRGDEHRAKDVELRSSQVLILGSSDGSRTFGTVMGITGIVVGSLGALLAGAVIAAPDQGPGSEDSSGRMGVLGMGVLGIAAGTGIAVLGFSFAAANRAPSMDLEQMAKAPPPARGAVTGISLSGKF